MPLLRFTRVSCRAACGLLLLLAAAAPAYAQITRLPHPDTTAGNFFGNAVAVDGGRALVGASGENACGVNSGAAYIFEYDAAARSWQQTARLLPSDCTEGLFFGAALSLSADRALVAAYRPYFSRQTPNAAYIFERDTTTGRWHEVARLTAATDEEEGVFAASVSLDADRALVTTSGDLAHGRYGGAAYVFERDTTGTWMQAARLTGRDGPRSGVFGGSGDLSGDYAVVAASSYDRSRSGSVYFFERDPESGQWREAARFGGIEDFFVSLDLDGARALVGESRAGYRDAGSVSVFERGPDGQWHQAGSLRPERPYSFGAFGTLVALDGDRALIAGYDEQLGFSFNIDRVVYVFERDPATNSWHRRRTIDVGEIAFGSAIDLDDGLALIGQASDLQPGAAYVVHVR